MSTPQLLKYEPMPMALPASEQGEVPSHLDLPRPNLCSGMPLMTALSFRCSTREFSGEPLTQRMLGELLRAANG